MVYCTFGCNKLYSVHFPDLDRNQGVMSVRNIIDLILSSHPEVSRQEIMERLEKEKKRTEGLIADDVLLQMIAADLGLETRKDFHTPTISVEDLVPSLSDTTVVGRVVALFPSKTFKADGSGKIASLLIVDENSVLRVVLWNDKADLVRSGEIKVGQIIRFSHGYTKEDRSGGVELHMGDKGEIEIGPKDVEAGDYPTISKFMTRIGEITQALKGKRINMAGTVKALFPTSTFERRDSSTGKVMRFVLADETGEIAVVVWNRKADELKEMVKKGVKLQVVNAKVKRAVSRKVEVHVNSQTYVETVETGGFSRISDVRKASGHINVKGTVVVRPIFRNVRSSKGELAKLAVFELKDETGRIWVSAWRKHADTVSGLEVGDKVIIRNGYVKKGFGDQPEVSTRSTSSITIAP